MLKIHDVVVLDIMSWDACSGESLFTAVLSSAHSTMASPLKHPHTARGSDYARSSDKSRPSGISQDSDWMTVQDQQESSCKSGGCRLIARDDGRLSFR